METVRAAKRVCIYIGEQDKAEGKHVPLWEMILEFLRQEGAAGGSMFRGPAGFGVHNGLRIAPFTDVAPDLPVCVEWIDSPERVERLLPRVSRMVVAGLITVEDIGVVKYAHRSPMPLPPDGVADMMTRDVTSIQLPDANRGGGADAPVP